MQEVCTLSTRLLKARSGQHSRGGKYLATALGKHAPFSMKLDVHHVQLH